MSNIDKVAQNLTHLISLTGVVLSDEDKAHLFEAFSHYRQSPSVTKSQKTDDEVLADFLLALSEDTNESDPLRQAARDLYSRHNAILIGLRIRDARKALGLSQTEFGKRFGKALRSIQKYESGEIEPSIATINIMARVLGVKPAELLGYPQPTVEVKTLADFAQFLYDLSCKREVKFSIVPLYDDDGEKVLGSSIAFEADEEGAEWNKHVVHLLRTFAGEIHVAEMLAAANPQDGREFMEGWLLGAQLFYSGAVLTDKLAPIKPRPASKGTPPPMFHIVRAQRSPEEEAKRAQAIEEFWRNRNQNSNQ